MCACAHVLEGSREGGKSGAGKKSGCSNQSHHKRFQEQMVSKKRPRHNRFTRNTVNLSSPPASFSRHLDLRPPLPPEKKSISALGRGRENARQQTLRPLSPVLPRGATAHTKRQRPRTLRGPPRHGGQGRRPSRPRRQRRRRFPPRPRDREEAVLALDLLRGLGG